MSVHIRLLVPVGPEEGAGFPGDGVLGSCESSMWPLGPECWPSAPCCPTSCVTCVYLFHQTVNMSYTLQATYMSLVGRNPKSVDFRATAQSITCSPDLLAF